MHSLKGGLLPQLCKVFNARMQQKFRTVASESRVPVDVSLDIKGELNARPLYFDFQATTPLDPRVLDEMLPYLSEHWGNPHSRTHAYGWASEKAMELARKQIADLIGADPREIIFTSGATESNNISVKGVARFYASKKKHIITTQTEHKCVLQSCRVLEGEGFEVTYLPVNQGGQICLEQLEQAITDQTSLVSIMTVNNEIGVIQPIEEIGRLCKAKKVFFHTDAAQAVGKIPLDVNKQNIDLMSISGHKIYGPKGVGALYIRRRPRVRVQPLQDGGGQERGLRSGTVPTPLVVGMGAACHIAAEEMDYDHAWMEKLSTRLVDRIMSELPDVIRNGDPDHVYPGCVNLSFAYVEGESLLMALKDVALSSGSACTSAIFVWRVLYQTGRALQACHSHLRNVTVLHRDIKPANVFLDSSGNVKLGDFGLARILHGNQTYSDTIVGTPYYMSPEVIKGSQYDRKSDIWAVGCLVYELCALSPPFFGCDLKQLASNIREGRFDPIPSNYSQDMQRIIELMLSVDHQFRPTIEMILHHPTVVLHVSAKSSFKFGNKRDSLKVECDKATLALVSEKIKALSTIEREPEEVSEDTFQEKWMVRLEALRQREANLRKREDMLIEKERCLLKKEKHVLYLERLSREKLIRAEVYLRQCKENRSSQASVISKTQKYKIIEDLDTSLSADPGDTSILPTSTKLDPTFVPPPGNFVRSASERRCKHVHFGKTSKVPALPNIQEVGALQKRVLGEIQVVEPTNMPSKKVLEDINDTEPVKLGAVPKKVDKSSTLKPILHSTINWEDERNMWLENKRAAYHSQVNKENVEQHQIYEVKEIKKRSSKLSLFTKKPSLR